MDILTGQFIKKIYTSNTGLFHVWQFSNQGKRCIVTLKGNNAPDLEGLFVLSGRWSTHPTHGPQFEASQINRYKTNTEKGNDYLNRIKGMLVV